MAACPHGRLAARGCVGMAPAYAGLRADRKAVRTDYRPPLDVTGLHLSHPSPACGRGAGGEGQPTHPNASNRAFVHMFYPPLKSPASGGNAVVGMRRSAVESPLAPTAGVHGGAAPRAGWCAAPPGAHAARRRCTRRGRRLAPLRCVVSRRSEGRCPSGSPLGTVPVPQTPPQVRWSAGRAAGADASVARNGCGGGPPWPPKVRHSALVTSTCASPMSGISQI
jgi:hypothetical protein